MNKKTPQTLKKTYSLLLLYCYYSMLNAILFNACSSSLFLFSILRKMGKQIFNIKAKGKNIHILRILQKVQIQYMNKIT